LQEVILYFICWPKITSAALVNMTEIDTLNKAVVILKIETNAAGASRRMRDDGHLAGCQIARELLRSAGSSFRITGLVYVEMPSY